MLRKCVNNIYQSKRICSYIIGFLICFLFLYLFWEDSIYGDASGYSFMAQQFIKFGLSNFNFQFDAGSGEELLFSLRGYAWPWLIAFFKIISFQTQIGWQIVYALFISFGFTFLIPEIFELLFGKKLNCIARIIPLLLTLFIWPGLVIYTLSDIPSIIFMAVGLYAVLLICQKNLSFFIKLILGGLAGFALGFSYYIRSGNMASLIFALLALAIYCYRKILSKKILIILGFCLGTCISAIPQIAININCNHNFSYQVPIFFTSNIGNGEYFNGVAWLRYETVISENYPEIAAIAQDDFAETLLKLDNIPANHVDATSLLKNVLKHPLEYIGIFSAKLANFMESRFGELYIQNFSYRNNGKVVFSFLLYFMSFAGILYFLSVEKGSCKREIGKSIELTRFVVFFKKYFCYIAVFLSPSLIHILGTHVESRYIFGLQLFLWQLLAGIIPWKEFAVWIWMHVITTFVLLVALLGCCSAIWNFTLEKVPFYQFCLQEKPEETYLSAMEFSEKYTVSSDTKYESCVNSFCYENGLIDLYGYVFKLGSDSANLKYTICFVQEGIQYYYPINPVFRIDVAEAYENSQYANSGIWFSNYLFDLKAGVYDVGIIVTDENESCFVDLVYDIEVQ